MTTTVLYDGILGPGDGVMLDVGEYESVAVQIHLIPFLDVNMNDSYPAVTGYPHFLGSSDGKQWSRVRILDADNPDIANAVATRSADGISYFRSAFASVLQWFMVEVRSPYAVDTNPPVRTFKVTVTGARR